jgi:hypothetical protein
MHSRCLSIRRIVNRLTPTCWCRPLALIALILFASDTAIACKVPVFRYALERWQVDRYRMVAIVDDSADPAVREAVERFQAIATTPANLETELIDLSKLSEADRWQLEDFDGAATTPVLQVFYPEKDGRRIKCWQGELSTEALSWWLDSSLRDQIVSDLVSGKSAVFLWVDGVTGDQDADEDRNAQAADRVQQALATAASEITIPAGVIPRDQASQYLKLHPEATMDDVLRSDVPLKVDFAFHRLTSDQPQEIALRQMIQGLVDDPEQPILVPIFGRGRMLDALPVADTDESVMLNVCRYLIGECSCTVKALNPGVDLLLNVDWSGRLGQAMVMVDSEFAEPDLLEPESPGPPALVDIPSGVAGSPTPVSPSPSERRSAWRSWAAIAIGITIFGTVLYRFLKIRRSG